MNSSVARGPKIRETPMLTYRLATAADCPLLAELNHQLIRDEGHRNRMTVAQLEQRIRGWLAGEYVAVLFEEARQAGDVSPPSLCDAADETREVVAYGLFRETADEITLRQFYVVPDRRRSGIGRTAINVFRKEIWPLGKRLTVEVLVQNTAAVAFWRDVGYRDYSLTLEIMKELSVVSCRLSVP
jgi:ribosomal protein S18 acetylase RimI-like enzyme